MTQLFAQPYNLGATGFYFESYEEFQEQSKDHKCIFGTPVAEYQIQFIDDEGIDCALAKAWGLSQANVRGYFSACEDWDEYQKQAFIIAVGEIGYDFDPDEVFPDNFDVDIYQLKNMEELAEYFVEEGFFGDIPNQLNGYIDYSAIARDLAFDYTETEIAGETLIYRLF